MKIQSMSVGMLTLLFTAGGCSGSGSSGGIGQPPTVDLSAISWSVAGGTPQTRFPVAIQVGQSATIILQAGNSDNGPPYTLTGAACAAPSTGTTSTNSFQITALASGQCTIDVKDSQPLGHASVTVSVP